MKSYTDIIRGLREDNDLKQTTVAKELGLAQQHYSKYETGETEMPLRILIALADYYKVSTDYLLGRTKCKEGIDGLAVSITKECSSGMMVSDVLALNNHAQEAIVEYIALHTLKQKVDQQREQRRMNP